jgi:non-homologous end joining protein Ku
MSAREYGRNGTWGRKRDRRRQDPVFVHDCPRGHLNPSNNTLHHAAEIRGIESVEELNAVPSTVKPEEIKLARQVIDTFEGPLDLANYNDEYREGLQRTIDAKIAGEE